MTTIKLDYAQGGSALRTNSQIQRLGGGAVQGDSGKMATYKINKNLTNDITRIELAILENRKNMEPKRLARTSISLDKLMESEGSYKPLLTFVRKLIAHFSPETVQEFVADMSRTVSKIKI